MSLQDFVAHILEMAPYKFLVNFYQVMIFQSFLTWNQGCVLIQNFCNIIQLHKNIWKSITNLHHHLIFVKDYNSLHDVVMCQTNYIIQKQNPYLKSNPTHHLQMMFRHTPFLQSNNLDTHLSSMNFSIITNIFVGILEHPN